MKNRALIFIITLLLVGCVDKNDTFNHIDNSGKAIIFTSQIIETKGFTVENNQFPNNESMGVMAYKFVGAVLQSNYIFNKKVTRQGDNYTYQNPEYWPSDDLVFFAYAPYTNYGTVNNGINVLPQTLGKTPAIEFQVDDVVANQVDLLLAATPPLAFQPNVKLNFNHALTKVRFLFRKKDQTKEVKIKQLTIKNVISKGSVSLIPELSGNYLWTPSDRPDDVKSYTLSQLQNNEILPDNEQNIVENVYNEIMPSNIYLLMIPQPIANGQIILEVKYTIDGVDQILQSPMPAAEWSQNGAWQSGKNINYNVTISPTFG